MSTHRLALISFKVRYSLMEFISSHTFFIPCKENNLAILRLFQPGHQEKRRPPGSLEVIEMLSGILVWEQMPQRSCLINSLLCRLLTVLLFQSHQYQEILHHQHVLFHFIYLPDIQASRSGNKMSFIYGFRTSTKPETKGSVFMVLQRRLRQTEVITQAKQADTETSIFVLFVSCLVPLLRYFSTHTANI